MGAIPRLPLNKKRFEVITLCVCTPGPCKNRTYAPDGATANSITPNQALQQDTHSGFKMPTTASGGDRRNHASVGGTVMDLDPEDMVAEPEPFFNASAVSNAQVSSY